MEMEGLKRKLISRFWSTKIHQGTTGSAFHLTLRLSEALPLRGTHAAILKCVPLRKVAAQ